VSGRGFYGIGIVGSKTPLNVGTLWRSAGILGAAFVFTAGRRYPHQASDTIKAWKHTPFFEFDGSDALFAAIPKGCMPIAVEMGDRAKPLSRFVHPERACYILGAEDTGVPKRVLDRCPYVVSIPGDHSLNVAVAGSIVLYDRVAKQGAVAQSVERLSEKQEVVGSIPTRPTLAGVA
jgi:tRNA G18 (ribose-2'-O)-methylase SpoU